jgi:putative sterol carrier protein
LFNEANPVGFSMIEEIFETLPESFVAGSFSTSKSYYFSLGEFKKTVQCSPESCIVSEGRAVENADCVCKTSPEFFLKIWQENYRPGMKDFMTGTIKSNNPSALQEFLGGFGKAD